MTKVLPFFVPATSGENHTFIITEARWKTQKFGPITSRGQSPLEHQMQRKWQLMITFDKLKEMSALQIEDSGKLSKA